MGKPTAPQLLAKRLRDVEEPEPGLPAERAVHRMRVAARRLRAALRVLGLRELDPAAKPLQDALGDVRDLQLQIAWLEKRDAALARRRASLLRKAERKLQQTLRAWHGKGLPRLLGAAGKLGHGAQPGGRRVPKLLRKRLKRFEERLDAALQSPGPRSAHRLRIAAKQVRYLFELAEDELPRVAKPLLKELKPLQDALGELHDADARMHLLRRARREALLRAEEKSRLRLMRDVAVALQRWKSEKIARKARRRLG
jgi:CHAD domain-containing protein